MLAVALMGLMFVLMWMEDASYRHYHVQMMGSKMLADIEMVPQVPSQFSRSFQLGNSPARVFFASLGPCACVRVRVLVYSCALTHVFVRTSVGLCMCVFVCSLCQCMCIGVCVSMCVCAYVDKHMCVCVVVCMIV